MKRPRRAAFTPLHHPRCERRPVLSGALEHRTLKRHECRAPIPEWDFVNQPDKHGCNNGQIQKPLLGGFAALILKCVLRFS
jgi:hypothetical protein